ncbi:hypothetical protein BDV32DRAFT_143043 [Aspergillus pseudonomiae]|uniref:Kinase-like domain-containing protein n=1 Tax=Aspergillus pseudonomiae TaxID=1506151 RepID=A0A5N6HKA7_9EURO|nr:uncharacterized protein BDV37DRAFT_291467 [Aspergillus pseudonomiae]KAB8254284.1 hypothetical protein BDV32DRAFT_143043 [Aspergillus pseudonomiae]KAE8398019.1 hypothetical protein BDV37DRAFT_291467 [Aspergillus pseudonomiae]
MELHSHRQWVGPFQIIHWPDQPGTYGRAKHGLTLEDASVRISWFGSIVHQAHTLQAAARGGIPVLHWFETVNDKEVMIMDTVGPTLEEVFTKLGRYFGMRTLLLFAEQMLARVEFIHSRNIYHGSLDPWSFALGSTGWHSWDEYLQEAGPNIPRDTAPFISTFLHKASASRTVDYLVLRLVFREVYLDLATHLAIGQNFKGPRAICKGFSIDPGALSTMDTSSLFEALSLKLSKAGKQVQLLQGIPTQREYSQLFECLDEILTIYGVLITPMGAYHLPNRLWRDLRWFMRSTEHERIEIRLTLVEKIYKYIATEYLLALACARKDVEPGSGKPAWT